MLQKGDKDEQKGKGKSKPKVKPFSIQLRDIVADKVKAVEDALAEKERKRRDYLLQKLGPGLKQSGDNPRTKILDTRIVSKMPSPPFAHDLFWTGVLLTLL